MKIKELSEEKNLGHNVEVTGLLESVEDKVAKTNNPYVKGIISEMGKRLEFRIWETNLEALSNSHDFLKPGNVITVEGEFQKFQNAVCLSVKNRDNIKLENEENPDNYTFSTPFSGEDMYKTIFKLVESFEDPALKKIATDILVTYKDRLISFPYSDKIHTEKGGLLYHIFQVISQIRKNVMPSIKGADVKPLNTELMFTAAVTSHLGGLFIYNVNTATGIIEGINENRKRLYDKFLDANCLQRILASDEYNSGLVEILIHMCLCTTTTTAPITPEAALFAAYDKAELSFYSMVEAVALAPDDVVNTKTKEGKFVAI